MSRAAVAGVHPIGQLAHAGAFPGMIDTSLEVTFPVFGARKNYVMALQLVCAPAW